MKLLALVFPLVFAGCSYFDRNEPVDTINAIENLKAKRDLYVSLIGQNPRGITTRCDGLTFVALYDSFGTSINIYDYEYPQGKWNRDIHPCYPDSSRSEISAEGIFSMLFSMLKRKDLGAVKRFIDYLEGNDFRAGEGPVQYTGTYHLMPLIYGLRDKLKQANANSNSSLSSGPESKRMSLPSFLSGYRSNVITMYLYLKALIDGYMYGYEVDAIRSFPKENPINLALIHRYTNGDQSEALSILLDERLFPSDRLPDRNEHIWNWSDAPSAILFIYASAIILGD